MTHQFAFFSKMFQAVPQLMEVHKHTGGIFVSNRRSTLNAVHKLYPSLETARYGSWFRRYSAGYKAMQQAAAIVTGAPTPIILSEFKARTCMVFHGTYMLLSKDALTQMRHFDLLCTIGPRMQKTVNRYHDELGLKRVMEIGYLPFGSFPEKDEASRIIQLEALGLSPRKPTVVYMPWGKPHGSWNAMAEKIALETPADYNLILRPHPSQGLTSRRADRASFRRVAAICASRQHTLLDINGCPLSQLFSLADLMVTDGTSPAEESLFYDVPQLLVQNPAWCKDVIHGVAERGKVPAEELEQYLELFNCGENFHVGRDQDFAQSIRIALDNKDRYRPRRAAYFDWVFGAHGRQAGDRAHQALLELIN